MLYDLSLGVIWYLTLTCLGVIVLPISMLIFRRMPECGILLSRPLGWLLLSYISWILAYVSPFPFSRLGLVLVGVGLFAVSLYLLRVRSDWTWRRLRNHWRTALNGEILTILAFLLILLVRREDPFINSTEKPMDAMMLSSLIVSSEIPPPDLWFADKHINYHYGGYLLHAVPAKLTGIETEYAYNLAIAAVAGMAASIAFVLGRALFGRCRWGIVTVICTLFVGNLAAAMTALFHGFAPMKDLYAWRFNFLWNSSRVIHDPAETINEYPFFSILWGDLHPHFSNIPFVLFFLAVCFAMFQALNRHSFKTLWRLHWPLLILMAVSGGFLLPTNIFDFPIFSSYFGALIVAAVLWRYSVSKRWALTIPHGVVVFLPIFGFLLVSPFWMNFVSPLQGQLIHVSPHHTGLFEFLLVFGAHSIVTVVYLVLVGRRLVEKRSREEIGFFFAALGIVFVLLWAQSGYLMYALSPLIALALWIYIVYRAACGKEKKTVDADTRELFALVACALAWSLIAACEFIYLKDQYASARMNTLFKFHFPAWILFGIGLPYLLYAAIMREKSVQIKCCAAMPAVLVLLISLFGPMYAFASIFLMPNADRPITLNGLSFMETAQPAHYEIIRWIRENSEPSDAILEAPGCGYHEENLVSAFTGRSAFIGWVNHEHIWRGYANYPEIDARKEQAMRFYTSKNVEDVKLFLEQYPIRYVIFTSPDPACTDTFAQLNQMQAGAFRTVLEPIIQKTGNAFGRTSPFELYRVPENSRQ